MANVRKLNIEITESRRGSGFKDAGDDVEQFARKLRPAGGALDKLEEAGGNTETRFLGLGAGISGVSTLLSGNLNAETAAMAVADLGDAVEHTVAPLLAQGRALVSTGLSAVSSAAQHVAAAATTAAAWVTMGVQATINAVKMAAAWVISLGPIALVIAAIAGIIAIFVALGIGFDDIANVAKAAWGVILAAAHAVWDWLSSNWPLVLAILTGPIGLAVLAIVRHWDTIKAGFTAVKDWIGDRISDVVGFFTGLPDRLARAASGLWDFITTGFKSAVNAVIRMWNGLRIPGIHIHQSLPGPIPDLDFDWDGFDLPNIPTLDAGGITTRPTLAALSMNSRPEAVIPLDRGGVGGDTIINVHVDGSVLTDGRRLVDLLNDTLATGKRLQAQGRGL